MSTLQGKVDFSVILRVLKANPNGDPLNGNQPRTDYNGYGEISDVCIKRKMRDRLMEKGESIFIQPKDRQLDKATSLKDRAESGLGKEAFVFTRPKNKAKRSEGVEDAHEPSEFEQQRTTELAACAKWFDVRAFGNLFCMGCGGRREKEGSRCRRQDEKTKRVHSYPRTCNHPVCVQSCACGRDQYADHQERQRRR